MFLEKATAEMKYDIEFLIQGETIFKEIRENIFYSDIGKNSDCFWSVLYFTGYLKKVSNNSQSKKALSGLQIPNEEIKLIFDQHITEWLKEEVWPSSNFERLYEAIRNVDVKVMEEELELTLIESISYLDPHENFHHGYLGGILKGMPDYVVRSNRENGLGRCDIFLKQRWYKEAIIFELKEANTFFELEQACDAALKQIEDRGYDQELINDGYPIVHKIGIAFFKNAAK